MDIGRVNFEGTSVDVVPDSPGGETIMDTVQEDMPIRGPSLQAYEEAVAAATRGETKTPTYSENLTAAVEKTKPFVASIERDFRTLGDKQPPQRAMVGGKMGAVIGGGARGLMGSLIGAGVGAFAGRALGEIQSGDRDAAVRFGDSLKSLMETGIINQKGQFLFPEEEGTFDVNLDPSYRLPNTSAIVTGKTDRKITEVDTSSPFANRAGSIAKALGYYQVWERQKWNQPDNPKDKRSVSEATGLFANAITNNAKSMDLVRKRAQHLFSTYGLDEKTARSYFSNISSRLSTEDALEIKKGLDLIFGGGRS